MRSRDGIDRAGDGEAASVEPLAALPNGKLQLHLTGFMGSGKSTVGQILARRLLWNFLDLDGISERHAEKSIREIFAEDGEAAFREIERHVLRQVVQKPRSVVALGGGTLLDAENLELCRRIADLVWLECPPEIIVERMGASSPERPLWGSEQELGERLAERLPGYRSSDAVVDAAVEPDRVVDAILVALGVAPRRG